MTYGAYSRPKQLTLDGADIKEVEVAGADSVRIYLKDGTFILVSPSNRDVHRPTEDLLIEVFPDGIGSISNGANP